MNANNICWPVERCNLMAKSYNAYINEDYLPSIFYECEALSVGLLNEYGDSKERENNNNNVKVKKKKPTKKLKRPKNTLLTYAERYTSQETNGSSSEYLDQTNNIEEMSTEGTYNVKQGIKDLIENNSALPKEWVVVQLCKMNLIYRGCATSKKYYGEPNPIKFTMFRYPQSHKLDNEPLCCHLDMNEMTNFFEDLYHLYYESYKEFANTMAYTEIIQAITVDLSKCIEKLKLWMGPWIVLLSGKIKGQAGEQFEQEIYNQVDEFSTANQLTVRQNVLLSLVTRRMDLINYVNIPDAATFIAKTRKQSDAIASFLKTFKDNTSYKDRKYYPLILILDENLDTIPWEMLNPEQETTRFNSIHMLFSLYKEYKDAISDGYLKLKILTGNSLINPNADVKLSGMVRRMSEFWSYWMPHWKSVKEQTPTECEMREIISSTDIYVYSGHGSSLQYFNFDEIATLTTKTVMLLFGCESAALTLNGWVSEATMLYMQLHAAKCPFIMGALCIITDLWTDVMSVLILSRWVPSAKKNVWMPHNFSGTCFALSAVSLI